MYVLESPVFANTVAVKHEVPIITFPDGHTEHEGYNCVFRDGEIMRHQTFGEIRQLVKSQLEKFV